MSLVKSRADAFTALNTTSVGAQSHHINRRLRDEKRETAQSVLTH